MREHKSAVCRRFDVRGSAQRAVDELIAGGEERRGMFEIGGGGGRARHGQEHCQPLAARHDFYSLAQLQEVRWRPCYHKAVARLHCNFLR